MSHEAIERQRRILARLVTEYIEQGEPVSSAWLAEHSRTRPVLGDGPQHSGAPRGAGPRPPATHVGGPRADRLGLSPVRGWAAGHAQARRVCSRRSRPDCAARGRWAICWRTPRRRLSRASQHIGFALAPASALGAAAPYRLREPRRPSRAGDRGCDGRPDHAQSHRTAGAVRSGRPGAGSQLHQQRVRRPHAPRESARPSSSGCGRSGCSTTRSSRARCSSPLGARGVHTRGDAARAGRVAAHRSARRRVRSIATARCRRCARCSSMIEEKHRLVELLSRYIEANGLTVVIGSENFVSRPPSVQPRRFHVPRPPGRRHGRRHRPDADAVSEGDLGRGRRLPGHDAGAGRTVGHDR